MNLSTKRISGKLLSAILVLLLTLVLILQLAVNSRGNERYFSGDAELYYKALIAEGFPEDYAVLLTELHLLHPSWSFQPLLVSETDKRFDWDYVIEREIEKGDVNVIYSSDSYSAYHHPTNRTLYDSGYYQASRAAVEYFMDPRNFLNETDIFQFYTLSGADGVTLDAVNAVLAGTFMENTVLENGKTYADYFMEIGKELDVNPVFLAAKVRQEQGTLGTSPIISGGCGSKLYEFYRNHTQVNDKGDQVLTPSTGYTEAELTALNGYYNYFNVGATGNGLFKIYLNAMQYAKAGTPDRASAWGGSPAWNTRWKSLYGGTYFLKTKYIDQYQSTVYLQKFNVDGRGESPFSRQYMTAVFGSLGEGRSLYQSFSVIDALDMPATFLIPIYADMPSRACADPAKGACSYTAQATAKYSYQSELTKPKRFSAESKPIYLDCEVYPSQTLEIGGVVTHSYALKGLEYAWDGGAWQYATDSKTLDISLPVHFSENSSHILVVRGRAGYTVTKNGVEQTVNMHFLYAVIYVKVLPPPSVRLSLEVGSTVTDKTVLAGVPFSLPVCDAPDFVGWCSQDGGLLPSGAEVVLDEDHRFSAVFLNLIALDGASITLKDGTPALTFTAVIEKDAYERLTAHEGLLSLSATLADVNGAETIALSVKVEQKAIIRNDGSEWLALSVSTDALDQNNYALLYSADFSATVRYTDQAMTTVSLSAQSDARSACQIANAALEDDGVFYGDALHAILYTISGST